MRKIKKILILILFFIFINTINVFADTDIPKNVQLIGKSEGIVFIPEDKLFLQGLNMVPGDKVSGSIIIENNHNESFELFIRVDDIANNSKNDLLTKLNLKIEYNNKIIYSGTVVGENGLAKNISLGYFNPDEKAVLYANVELDGPSIGNEYKNKSGKVQWIFTAITAQQTQNPNKDKPLPNTGEETVVLYLGIAILLVGIGGYIIKEKGRKGA